MKRMQAKHWLLAAVLLLELGGAARAEEFAIQSFNGSGLLTFNRIPTGEVYRVECANTPTGVWSKLTSPVIVDGILTTLDCLPRGSGSGIVTCTVPTSTQSMFFRTVVELGDMVLIPGGTNAGTDPDFGAYRLTVESFCMDRHVVTKTLWDEVRTWAATNGYTDLPAGGGKAANHPVAEVSWYDVVKWCNARSQKAGLTPVYYQDADMTQVYKTEQVLEPYVKASANGYRLPTDVEWEYAARGGVANRRFPWGDEIQHARANYYSSSSYSYDTSPTRDYHPTYNDGTEPYTSPVGAFTPNGYGLYDMAGNVWEWCYDWYPGHQNSYRVIRGGGWIDLAYYCRVAYRDYDSPDIRDYDFGFRAVLPSGQ
ncbi:MAG: SUMF1/EgtB/PvdO family nonheme iron enzyme [Kiritimatiellae bacterium]|nr:SUMF1/EgtB/PvdO family nonheme iron enzyme [Kiritimatiellia bacterium]